MGENQSRFARRIFNDWREKGLQTIKNIFPLIYDFENLFNAYKKAIKCKRYRADVMEYTDRLEENLIELQNELIWKTYSVGRTTFSMCMSLKSG